MSSHRHEREREEERENYLVVEHRLVATVTVVDRTGMDDAEGDTDRHQQLDLCCDHDIVLRAKIK